MSRLKPILPPHHPLPALALALLGLAASPSWADSQFGVDLKLGTLALGADLVVKVNEAVNLRIGYAGFGRTLDFNENNIRYRGTARLSTPSLLVDWALLDGDFRVTGGLVGMKSHVDATGIPTVYQTYTINNTVYSTSDIGPLTGRAQFGSGIAPYVGMGWGNALRSKRHWSWVADLGVIYAGSPSVTLVAPCKEGLDPDVCAVLQTDLAAERDKAVKDIIKFKWYPVASLGLAYRF